MRDYDPTTGRYIQADPLGLVDGASVYGYARQNPGRYVDLRGEKVVYVCRPLETGGGGVSTWRQHCAVFVVEDDNDCGCDMAGDPDGILAQFSLAGGNSRFDDQQNPSSVFVTDRNAYLAPDDPENVGKWHIQPPNGVSSCEYDNRVIRRGNTYSQRDYSNWPGGANSNTAATQLIVQTGGTPPYPGAWNEKSKP